MGSYYGRYSEYIGVMTRLESLSESAAEIVDITQWMPHRKLYILNTELVEQEIMPPICFALPSNLDARVA